jgi:hypothetical protein
MNREKVKLYKTEEWHEEMGECIFLAFPSFAEFPCVQPGSPLDGDFDECVWTHFILLDFNHVFDQAISQE